MVERGQELRLALEAHEALGFLRDLLRENLDRSLPAEGGVGGPVHLAHAAGSDGSGDAVVGERVADQGPSRLLARRSLCSFDAPAL
jgi:hypothetical protein